MNTNFFCPSAALTRLEVKGATYTSASQRADLERFEELQNLQFATSSSSTAWHQRQRKQLAAEQILRFGQLKENWDGEGAIEIAPTALEMASALLHFLPDVIPAPDVSPNPNGTLSLYWALPHGSAELEIGRTRHSWVLLNRDGKASQTCSGDNRAFQHDQPVKDLVGALIPYSARDAGTRPLTRLTMLSRWNDFLEAF